MATAHGTFEVVSWDEEMYERMQGKSKPESTEARPLTSCWDDESGAR
ncbi:hypothetical protein BH23CHL8_BH23CHL8_31210 [soil metagenome]